MNITDRQLEIIQAAGKLLASKGLSGLTVKTLAAEMGFVESALYRHFKSKDDILVLMLEYLYQNIQERFEPILAQDVDAKTKLVQIFDSQFRYFRDNPHFVIVVLSDGLIDESEGMRNQIIKMFLYKIQIINELVSQCISNGKIQPVLLQETLIHFLMGGFRLTMFKWKTLKFSFDLVKEGNQMIDDFFTLVTQNAK
ncbi:MAG TPA: TetR/AcrR family transcriptional regulator [Saprospiraceae bacterium]|nr:TetR/AcrR family transcriptional regulator [Saprospiraceae bacterium]